MDDRANNTNVDLTGYDPHSIIPTASVQVDSDMMVAFHYVDGRGRPRRKVWFRIDKQGNVQYLHPTDKHEEMVGAAVGDDLLLIVVLPL